MIEPAPSSDKFEKSNKLDKLTAITAIGTMLGALGAIGAAFVAVRGLDEVRAQRDATYRPQLVAIPSPVYQTQAPAASLKRIDQAGRKYHIVDFSNLINFIVNPTPIKSEVAIYNLGLGAAKSIQYQWSIGAAELVSRINVLSNYIYKELMLYQSAEDGIDVIMFQDGELPIRTEYAMNFSGSTPYLLPNSINNTSKNVYIPQHILRLSAIYCSLVDYARSDLSKPEADRNRFVSSFGDVNIALDVKYEDISSNEFVLHQEFVVVRQQSIGHTDQNPAKISLFFVPVKMPAER